MRSATSAAAHPAQSRTADSSPWNPIMPFGVRASVMPSV